MNNPYATPKSDLDVAVQLSENEEKIAKGLASGQRIIIYAILIYLAAIFIGIVSKSSSPLFIIPVFLWFGLSIFGVFKVLKNLKMYLVFKILYCVLLFIPLINLLALVSLSTRATKALKEAGYSVGLLGAKEPDFNHRVRLPTST